MTEDTVVEKPNEPRKRLRLTVVCESCKRKKIKCDKQVPCNSCVKAKLSSSCVYKSALPYISSARRPIDLGEEVMEQFKEKPVEIKNGLYDNVLNVEAKPIRAFETKYDGGAFEKSLGSIGVASIGNIVNSDTNNMNDNGNLTNINGSGINGSGINGSGINGNGIHGNGNKGNGINENGINGNGINGNGIYGRGINGNTSNDNGSANANTTDRILDGYRRNIFNEPPKATCEPNKKVFGDRYHSLDRPFGISNPEQYKNQLPPARTNSAVSFPSSTASPIFHNNSSTGSLQTNTSRSSYTQNIALPPLNRPKHKSRACVESVYLESTDLESLIGVNPFTSTGDTIDFYQGSDKGIFSMSYLMQTDPGLKCLQKYVNDQNKINPGEEFCPDDSNTEIRKLATLKLNREGLPVECYYTKQVMQSLERQEGWESMTLNEKILSVMPAKNNIWLLIERFFRYAYPFVPIIDEKEFMSKMTLLIGQKTVTENVKPTRINITSRLDYITLGQLLIMLRLSFISLFKNNEVENMQSINHQNPQPSLDAIQFLIKSPIDIAVVNITRECLALFQKIEKGDDELGVIQLTILVKVYLKYAPEEENGGDGEGEMLVTDDVLDMAYRLGLDRDPEILNPDENANFIHLKRKLWFSIVVIDVFQSYMFGIPPRVANSKYDTVSPQASIESSNLIDYERDRQITLMNYCRTELINSLKFLTAAIVTKDRKRCFVVDIVDRLNHFETLYFKETGRAENIIKVDFSPDVNASYESREADLALVTVKRNFDIKYFLAMGSVIMAVHFALYCHYQSIGDTNIAYFYLRKCLLFINEVAPHFHHLLDLSDTYSDFMYNPSLQSLIHKGNQIIQVLIVRFSFILHHNKYNNNLREEEKLYFDLLRKVKNLLIQHTKLFMKLIAKLSHRYYYSWRINKGGSFFLAIINNENFYSTVMASRETKLKIEYVTPQFNKTQLLEIHRVLSLCDCLDTVSDENPDLKADTSSVNSTAIPTPKTIVQDNFDVDQMWMDVFFNPKDNHKDATLFDLFNEFQFDAPSV